MSIVVGYDTTGANVSQLPKGAQVAGYDTGSGVVPWTPAQFAAHPGAIHIDQDPGASDTLSDVLDVEQGAATFADCPRWVKGATASFSSVKRAGQRWPAIYASSSNLPNVANALINGGISSGVYLWVANWSKSEAQAIAMITSAGGPFPVMGVQFSDPGPYDVDVWSKAWLDKVSGVPVAVNPVSGLTVVSRGFTSITLAWDSAKNATSYTVKATWRGKLAKEAQVTTPAVRMGSLAPSRTYTFTVRAHPGGSAGSDASIKSTTRPA